MPTDRTVWTIDQLTDRVGRALADGYPGQTSGRVRDVPNIRTIRWYTTIGLLDRPAEMRGRTAYYGARHLAQIVAIKRLQAAGRSLAEVQEALLGADDATLFGIAGLTGIPADTVTIAADVTNETTDETTGESTGGTPDDETAPDHGPAARSRFWAPERRTAEAPARRPEAKAAPKPAPRPAEPATATAPLVQGIPLAPDVTLLLTAPSRTPGPAERSAVEEAARPLLDTLRRLGLIES